MKQDMAARSANRSLTSKAVTYKTLGGYEVIEFVETHGSGACGR